MASGRKGGVAGGGCREERHGGRVGGEVGVVEAIEEAAQKACWGFWLEFVAEVRRAVSKGSARPNMVKGGRRKVSSATKVTAERCCHQNPNMVKGQRRIIRNCATVVISLKGLAL
jgi:hypothetical protein